MDVKSYGLIFLQFLATLLITILLGAVSSEKVHPRPDDHVMPSSSPMRQLELAAPVDVCEPFQTGGLGGLLEFSSPGYPEKYPPNVNCLRLIQAPPGYDIALQFIGLFEIEASYGGEGAGNASSVLASCPNDYLEARDGRYSFSESLALLCGMRLPVGEIRARSGFLWLNFHSDGLLEFPGFSARYEFVRSSHFPLPTPCHYSFTMPLNGRINMDSLIDFYSIDVPRWLSVALFIEEFELATPNQCHENYLEIYASATARQPMRRYCGLSATHVYTGQSTVYVRFFAAGPTQVHASSVRLLFSSYVARLFACGDDICIPKTLVCNGNANCLFRKDEINCEQAQSTIESLLTSNHSPLFTVLLLISTAVLVLCIRYRPFKVGGEDEGEREDGPARLLRDREGTVVLSRTLNVKGRPKLLDDFEDGLLSSSVKSSPITPPQLSTTDSSSVNNLEEEVLTIAKLGDARRDTASGDHHPNCDRNPQKARRQRRQMALAGRQLPPLTTTNMGNGTAFHSDHSETVTSEGEGTGATDQRRRVRIVYVQSKPLREIPHFCACTYIPVDEAPSPVPALPPPTFTTVLPLICIESVLYNGSIPPY